MAGNEEFYKNCRAIFSLGTFFPDTKSIYTVFWVFFFGSYFYHVKCLPRILGAWDPIKGRLAMNAMKVGIDQLFPKGGVFK